MPTKNGAKPVYKCPTCGSDMESEPWMAVVDRLLKENEACWGSVQDLMNEKGKSPQEIWDTLDSGEKLTWGQWVVNSDPDLKERCVEMAKKKCEDMDFAEDYSYEDFSEILQEVVDSMPYPPGLGLKPKAKAKAKKGGKRRGPRSAR